MGVLYRQVGNEGSYSCHLAEDVNICHRCGGDCLYCCVVVGLERLVSPEAKSGLGKLNC